MIWCGIEPRHHKSFKFKMIKTIKKLLDWPPLWLAAALALAYPLRHLGDWAVVGDGARVAGVALVAAGVVLMTTSALLFWERKTTIVPHRIPSALITHGVYRYSRNPIYLADVFILLGAILYWNAFWALILVPVFMAAIEWRFIRPEEARLRTKFGPEFAQWASVVRRWI